MAEASPTESVNGAVLANKYQIVTKIGSGSFGEIFLAKNTKTGEDVAVKLESKTVVQGEHKTGRSQLKREAKMYAKLFGEVGISKIRWLGLGEEKNWMVMDLLGRNLEDLFTYCGRKFSLKTVTIIACELICRIETIHNKGKLVHRDIKPANFLMGRGVDRHTVFIVDFGLARLYENPRTGQHIPFKEDCPLIGTVRYLSLNAHLGHELSRRDDLIAIGYVLVYFLKGRLPWQGINGKSLDEKYQITLEKKQSTSFEELCHELPDEFLQYFEAVVSLGFDEAPDYVQLKNLFKQLFTKNNFEYDKVLYDWEILRIQQQDEEQQASGRNKLG